jgi:hypothetical protein
MARKNEELEDDKLGGDTVMVGGMDDLVGKTNGNLEVEIDEPPPKPKALPVAARTVDDSDDDEIEDARLAYDDTDDELEERGGRGRRARRNRSRREATAGTLAEVTALQQQVERLTSVLDSMGQQQVGLTVRNIDQSIADATQALRMADAEIEKAISEGNGQRFREVNALRDEAQARLFQLSGAKNRIIEDVKRTGGRVVPQGGQMPAAASGLTPKAQEFTERFLSRFSYFDPEGTDTDTLVMKAIDDSVAAEGYRPDTKMYWVELERRLAEKGYKPDPSGARREAQDDDDGFDPPPRREAREEPPPQRRYRPTSGGHNNRRGTGTAFTLDPQMKDYLESEGILDPTGLDDAQKARRTRLLNAWRENTVKARRGEFNRT